MTADEIGGAFVRAVDIRDGRQVDDAFAAAAEENGPIHALVANSGSGGPNEPGANDRFDDLVATNLVGTYRCIRAAQRSLAEGPARRDIVVISSILARIAVPGYTGYSASKAGLLGLVRSLAAELAAENVQVNAICPGWVDTDMAWEASGLMAEGMGITPDAAYDTAMQEVPLRRMSHAGGHRGNGRVATLARLPRGHRAGDRSERRRVRQLNGARARALSRTARPRARTASSRRSRAIAPPAEAR